MKIKLLARSRRTPDIFLATQNGLPNLNPQSHQSKMPMETCILSRLSRLSYSNHLYRKSLFFKAPLLFLSCNVEEFLAPVSFLTFKSYKTNVKGALLRIQNEGDSLNWQTNNIPLYNISVLRKSCITRRDANYFAE